MRALPLLIVLGLAWTLPASTPTAANVYTVDDSADEPDAMPGDMVCATAGGTCTLRAAFMEAEASNVSDVDEIILPAGDYRLTRPHTPRPAPSSADGDLVTGIGPLTLTGAGADVTTIEQTVEDRVIHVYRSEAVIQGVTVRGGRALSDEPEDDFAFVVPRNWGGGILASRTGSSLTLRSAVVTRNEASGQGGGAMALRGIPVVLENAEISDNRAGESAGGLSTNWELDMSFSTVSGNEAGECGGIAVGVVPAFEVFGGDVPVRIRRSRITGNEALAAGPLMFGAIWPGLGGGICVFSARTDIEAFGGDFALEDSLVQGNVGGGGGGLHHRGVAGMEIVRSTFVGNNAQGGGALLIHGSGRVQNSTLSGNRAVGAGGAIDHEKLLVGYIDGLGIFRPASANLTLRFSTIFENGGGMGLSAQLFSSHISNNAQILGSIFDSGRRRTANCNPGIDSIGSNLDSGTTCLTRPGPGDMGDVDPQLESLGDNGGPTPTHALRSTSPAIDAYVLGAGCPGFDQRLSLRPAGAACDAGSYEADATPFDIPSGPPLAPGDVGGGSVRLVVNGGVFQALSAQGTALEPISPADGKDATWFLPSAGGYLGETRTLLVQRGGLDFTRGNRRFETADWVVRVRPDGGGVWSYAGKRVYEPPWLRFTNLILAYFEYRGLDAERFSAWLRPSVPRPLLLFRLEPTGQDPDLLVALLTRSAAKQMNRRLNLRFFKPEMEFGTLRLEPELVDPKDPPGDPIPPPNNPNG